MRVDGSEQADVANLEKVEHVVVLMLENRSFDHMLGYLSLNGGRPDIDGLRPEFANKYQGRIYPVHHLDTTTVDVDPDHSASAVDVQIADGTMGGFAASLAATLVSRGIQDGDPALVMGYYDGDDVPVYDHLAEEFAVCDRWFSPVPGASEDIVDRFRQRLPRHLTTVIFRDYRLATTSATRACSTSSSSCRTCLMIWAEIAVCERPDSPSRRWRAPEMV